MVDGTGPGFGFNLGTGLVLVAIIGRDGVRIRCYAKVRPKLGLNSNLVQHCNNGHANPKPCHTPKHALES